MPATKASKAKPNRYANMSYFHLLKEAEKPIADRRELPIARDGKSTTLRRYHIPSHEIDQFKASHRDGDPFPNPHNSGCYHFILEALKELGVDKEHAWDTFQNTLERLMSAPETKDGEGKTLWQRFKGKESKSENPRDVDGKIQQNVEVLQRMSGKTPYGYRFHQIAQQVLHKPGACIDVYVKVRENNQWVALEKAQNPEGKVRRKFIKLNLHPTLVTLSLPGGNSIRLPVPVNQTKRRRNKGEDVKEVVKEVRKTVSKRKSKAKTEDVALVSVTKSDGETTPVHSEEEAEAVASE